VHAIYSIISIIIISIIFHRFERDIYAAIGHGYEEMRTQLTLEYVDVELLEGRGANGHRTRGIF